MHTYDKYWLTNLGRGILALLASIGAGFLPSFVDSTISRVLFMPFAMAISIVCLSLYGILDCSLLVITGHILPKGRKVHWLVILQGFTGLVSLVASTILAGDGLNLRFFVLFAGVQAPLHGACGGDDSYPSQASPRYCLAADVRRRSPSHAVLRCCSVETFQLSSKPG